jgi:hypothetical protein
MVGETMPLVEAEATNEDGDGDGGGGHGRGFTISFIDLLCTCFEVHFYAAIGAREEDEK